MLLVALVELMLAQAPLQTELLLLQILVVAVVVE
jgi:hypothetical protein